MNAIKQTKLTMALGAALVAGTMTANLQAQELSFQEFSRQARANALDEATRQPGTAERINELRGALAGARVIAGLPSAEQQGEEAQAAIRAEQLADLQSGAPAQLAGSLQGVRVVAGMPSADEQAEQALAAIRAEQLDDLTGNAGHQLAASLAGAQVMTSVADATPASKPKLGEWSMPEVEFKPLIDMSILHFSFKK